MSDNDSNEVIFGDAKAFATDVLLQEQIFGHKYKPSSKLANNSICIKVSSKWIKKHILNTTIKNNRVINASWTTDTRSILHDITESIINNYSPPLPKQFRPISIKGTTRVIKLEKNVAIIKCRCKYWEVGCSTECDITVPITELGYLRKIKILFQFNFFTCDVKHAVGTVIGNATIKTPVITMQTTVAPRINQTMLYSNIDYNPFTSVRIVPTHSAMRNISSKYNKKVHTLHDDWFTAINLMQQMESRNKYFTNLDEPWRGNIHCLQNIPQPKVVVYNEPCLVFFKLVRVVMLLFCFCVFVSGKVGNKSGKMPELMYSFRC
eukprot:51738_1